VVEHLPSILEALGSVLSTAKINENTNKKKRLFLANSSGVLLLFLEF
jgi:hypothetical protein